MSSILKALKKVETDNATRRPDELRIDAEILRVESPSRFSSSGILMVSLLLVAFGAGGTYLFMKRDMTPEQTSPISSTISGQKRQSDSAAPEIAAELLPPAIIVAPAKQPIVTEGKSITKRPPPNQAKGAVPVTKRPVVAAQPAAAPQPPPPLPAPAAITAPALRVNGIALQDDRLGGVAMINGEPISNGGMIAGVKVEQIYKNRVKFSYNGETFEVLLGQSNR